MDVFSIRMQDGFTSASGRNRILEVIYEIRKTDVRVGRNDGPNVRSCSTGKQRQNRDESAFEFVVGNKVVPAGECVVKAATADIKMVTIRNGEAKVALFATIQPIETGKPAGHYALVFHQYGDRYFLWGMKIEGTRVMYQLPESKAEIELRAQNVPASDKILLAYLQ